MKLPSLTEPPPRWLIYPAFVLAIASGAFVGRFLLDPPAPEVRTEFIELKARKEKKTETKKVARSWKVVIEPNGKRTEEATERELSRSEAMSTETSSTTATTTVTAPKPDWRVGLQAGATWKEPALQLAGPLVIGVSVEGRIAQSPVSVGAWGSTFGAAGGSISIEF